MIVLVPAKILAFPVLYAVSAPPEHFLDLQMSIFSVCIRRF
jgi:hypothetical protein